MANKKYNYFVSFSHRDGFGNCSINFSEPITEFESIKAIEEEIMARDKKAREVTVLNFQLLSVENAE